MPRKQTQNKTNLEYDKSKKSTEIILELAKIIFEFPQSFVMFLGQTVKILLLDQNLQILWSCSFFKATYIKFWSYWDDEGWIFV